MANKLNQWRNAKRYSAKLNLLRKIENEITPQLEAMRRADDLLDRVVRSSNGIDAQGYSNLPGCSRLDVYTLTSTTQPGSMVASDSFDACVINGMTSAENNTRNIADNS